MIVGRKKTKSDFSALQSHLLMYDDDNNDVELVKVVRIKASGRFFNSIAATNKYVKTFTFGEDCLHVQIDIVENCRKKISIRSTAYTRLATKFLFDGFWGERK